MKNPLPKSDAKCISSWKKTLEKYNVSRKEFLGHKTSEN